MSGRTGSLRLLTLVGGFLLSGLLVVALLSVVGPVAREHCLVQEGKGAFSLHVESSWDFDLDLGNLSNPAPDTPNCVRNTPLREGLSAVGVWELGSAEDQLAEHTAR
jgi:hypothetical protein